MRAVSCGELCGVWVGRVQCVSWRDVLQHHWCIIVQPVSARVVQQSDECDICVGVCVMSRGNGESAVGPDTAGVCCVSCGDGVVCRGRIIRGQLSCVCCRVVCREPGSGRVCGVSRWDVLGAVAGHECVVVSSVWRGQLQRD